MSDLIKREDAITAVMQCTPFETKGINLIGKCEEQIKAIPSADRPQGEWIDDGFAHCCSECGKQGVGIEYYNYCPNCGAKMKGEDDEV